jgi:hypothetical protein
LDALATNIDEWARLHLWAERQDDDDDDFACSVTSPN